jgi:hypothetical protein
VGSAERDPLDIALAGCRQRLGRPRRSIARRAVAAPA